MTFFALVVVQVIIIVSNLQVSPIECAIEMLENNNKQLYELVTEHQNDRSLTLNPLTMKIQGIVDAAVNGNFLFIFIDLILL